MIGIMNNMDHNIYKLLDPDIKVLINPSTTLIPILKIYSGWIDCGDMADERHPVTKHWVESGRALYSMLKDGFIYNQRTNLNPELLCVSVAHKLREHGYDIKS